MRRRYFTRLMTRHSFAGSITRPESGLTKHLEGFQPAFTTDDHISDPCTIAALIASAFQADGPMLFTISRC